MSRLLGLKDLIHDAVEETTNLVEETQESVARKYVEPLERIDGLTAPVRAVDGLRRVGSAGVYGSIRLVNRTVQRLLEVAGRAALPARLGEGALPWWAESAQGALNGFVGDHLQRRGNALAIQMGFYQHGEPLPLSSLARALPCSGRRACVFVHGLSCTEWSWNLFAEQLHGDATLNFGRLLQRDLGYTPLWLRYNSGLHVSENGRALAALLDELVAAWPTGLEDLVLIGHSMGGLVARSAVHYGAEARRPFIDRLGHVFCIAAPHLGAPLEKGVSLLAAALGAFDTAGTQVPARLLRARSVGIKDLRFGYLLDEDWQDRDPDAALEDNRHDVPFVDGVAYYFLASTVTRDPEHPLGRLLGDLLVRLPSASGEHPEPARRIPFHIGRVLGGLHHLHLVNHPDVYREIHRWLATDTGAR